MKNLYSRRQALLIGLGSTAFLGSCMVGQTSNSPETAEQQGNPGEDPSDIGTAPLKQRAASKGLLYGAASGQGILSTDADFANRLIQECNILSIENDVKWETLRPSPDQFNFEPGDWVVDFTQTHGLECRGHTLAWYAALPPWFRETVNESNAEYYLTNHIETVAGRYAGKLHSWDVVNEPIKPDDGRSDGLRLNPWLELLGTDYIDLAFQATAAVDPQALLVINEFDLEYDIPAQEAKRIGILKLLERLKSRGTPVHALGIQAHLMGNETRFNPEKYRRFLSDVASFGLKILITELDVFEDGLPAENSVRDPIIAGVYEDFLSVTLDESAVIGVITWGLSDRYTWLSTYRARPDGTPVRPLPLDSDLNRKLVWDAIARTFDRAPSR
jgi:endo-1,4-beta-xylanase